MNGDFVYTKKIADEKKVYSFASQEFNISPASYGVSPWIVRVTNSENKNAAVDTLSGETVIE